MAEISYSYIQIDPEGTVQNVAMFANYESANRITRAVYGDGAVAVEYRYSVNPGDKYRENVLYNVAEDGTETPAPRIPQAEDKILELRQQNDELTLALAEMMGGDLNA